MPLRLGSFFECQIMLISWKFLWVSNNVDLFFTFYDVYETWYIHFKMDGDFFARHVQIIWVSNNVDLFFTFYDVYETWYIHFKMDGDFFARHVQIITLVPLFMRKRNANSWLGREFSFESSRRSNVFSNFPCTTQLNCLLPNRMRPGSEVDPE